MRPLEPQVDLRPLWTIILLNAADAFATLADVLILGAQEANPLMRVTLDLGLGWFLVVKLVTVYFLAHVLTLFEAYRALRLLRYPLLVVLLVHVAMFIQALLAWR